ncbi:hypothetical protein ACJZL3_06890 [Wolbachia endosymbiont of Rhagoletis cingulata]
MKWIPVSATCMTPFLP